MAQGITSEQWRHVRAAPATWCRRWAWHSFAVLGLLDQVTAPVCTLGNVAGSDPGSTARKRLVMLVRGHVSGRPLVVHRSGSHCSRANGC